VLTELGDDEIRLPDGHPGNPQNTSVAMKPVEKMDKESVADMGGGDYDAPMDAPSPAPMAESISVTGGSGGGGRYVHSKAPKKSKPKREPNKVAPVMPTPPPPPPRTNVATGDTKVKAVTNQLVNSNKTIIIEGYADANTAGADLRANDRANLVRNQLIDQGVAPGRIKVVTKVGAGNAERVRLVAQAPTAEEQAAAAAHQKGMDQDAQPVGESHFANPRPMTVDKGSSAMVSMVRSPTEGEVVYLYDAESERGNARFAFRAVRFKNPTDSTLETGPVTVYGHERFIGEGLTEPIPPHAPAVVPFALDRQIVVERDNGSEDKIARLMSLQRGILTAEVQHVRRQRLAITNRDAQPATLFIRHTVAKGWTLLGKPAAFERVGDAHLFEVELKPGETKQVVIAEATPIECTLDLSADVTLEMMKVWVDAPEGSHELKDQLRKLLGLHRSLVDLAQEQDSMRRRLTDYRGRMDELHAQIVTLQAVKTGGDLMVHLKTKMKEISDRVQRTTIQIVDQEQKIMLAKVQFQDALAELSLPDALAAAPASAPQKK
jgi:hypothetical protein